MEYWSAARRGNWRILFSFLICFAWPVHALAKPVTLGYQTPTLSSNLPIFAAAEMGLFASANLEVKTVFIQGGPTAMAALIGGDVDYVKVAGIPAVRAIAQGAPVVIAGGFQPYIDYSLLGSKKVNNLHDLKGKVVGVTGAGGIAEFAAVEGLARSGFMRDRDYKILYGVGNSPARAYALEIEKIQASPFPLRKSWSWKGRAFRCSLISGKSYPNSRSLYCLQAGEKPKPLRKKSRLS